MRVCVCATPTQSLTESKRERERASARRWRFSSSGWGKKGWWRNIVEGGRGASQLDASPSSAPGYWLLAPEPFFLTHFFRFTRKEFVKKNYPSTLFRVCCCFFQLCYLTAAACFSLFAPFCVSSGVPFGFL